MYRAIVESEDGETYLASSNLYCFAIGRDGAGAVDTLLAGLCACVAHHVYRRAVARKIVFSGLTVGATTELAADGLSLARLELTLAFRDGALTGDDKADLARQIGRCPLYNTISAGVAICVSFS